MESIPDDILNKFGSWIDKITDMQGVARIETSRAFGDYYSQIKYLKKL